MAGFWLSISRVSSLLPLHLRGVLRIDMADQRSVEDSDLLPQVPRFVQRDVVQPAVTLELQEGQAADA